MKNEKKLISFYEERLLGDIRNLFDFIYEKLYSFLEQDTESEDCYFSYREVLETVYKVKKTTAINEKLKAMVKKDIKNLLTMNVFTEFEVHLFLPPLFDITYTDDGFSIGELSRLCRYINFIIQGITEKEFTESMFSKEEYEE